MIKPTNSQISLFAESELFFGLEGKEVSRILTENCEVATVRKGELWRQCGKLCCLIKGRATVRVINEGKKTVKQLQKGDIFGCAVLFDPDSVTDISAESDCTLLCISSEKMEKIFLEFPLLSLNYIKYLSRKIRYLNRRIGDFACTGAEEKLMHFLRENADSSGEVKVKMTLLAEQLGMGRTSLYRAIETLGRDQRILYEKNKIKIL